LIDAMSMTAPFPNVLLIVADDFGVHQLSCTEPARRAARFFETPHLDQLAAEGIRFARAYATAPVCSPARASLYTGMHPARLHVTDFIPGSRAINTPLLEPPWQRGLPVGICTLGNVLKARGYSTAHFGKWHLAPDYNYAPGRPMDPESHGFDEVFVTRKPASDADPESDPHHVRALTDRAMEFCTRARQQPFLCVLAHNAVHRPELAPASEVAKYAAKAGADHEVNRPVFGAMVEQLDAATGRLLAALRGSGRERDTLVIFTSDHGPLGPSARRKPLRGAKADLYEGGLRVPLLMRWPEKIAAGAVREQLVSGADIFPTIVSACGGQSDSEIDGVSLWPLVLGERAGLPRDTLHWHYPHYHHLGPGPCAAIRVGDWKLIEWFGVAPRYELFDLAADPGEEHDLAANEPAQRDELRRKLQAWRDAVGAQMMQPNRRYNPAEPTHVLPPEGDSALRRNS
jgi:arylsulfatase A